jgi:hypothetical protein
MCVLKDLQMKNSHNGESNHPVIAVYKLQVFLYNYSKTYWWQNWRKMFN